MTKHFLATGATATRLGVTRSQLQNLFPYLPYLYISKRQTRLFPAAYIEAYAASLSRCGKPATIGTARSFWTTPGAGSILDAAQTRIKESLNSNIHYTANELMALLDVSRMTVTVWYQGGVFRAIRQQNPPKRARGKSWRVTLLIPAADVKKALVWKLPD